MELSGESKILQARRLATYSTSEPEKFNQTLEQSEP